MDIQSIPWKDIQLVVFDVDGTLYNQKKLRIRMMLELLKQTFLAPDFAIFSIIKHYRDIREALGDEEVDDFEAILLAQTSQLTGYSEDKIKGVIHDWIETKPLPFLLDCRFDGLLALFSAIKKQGKIIGILSDYKAVEKLKALGLTADLIVSAGDDAVKILKPHPKGLQYIMLQAGVDASETILIGDRDERDGMAARRAGTHYLIKKKSSTTQANISLDPHFFINYTDAIFHPILEK